MPGTIINPTRMELTRLKRQLRTAQRGHKLLRDKRDELMKQFMETVRENRALRQRVEQGLSEAHASFTVAAALMTPEMLGQSLLIPSRSVELDMSFENIMSVEVPRYHFTEHQGGSAYPYGYVQTSGELDDAVASLSGVFRDMLRLAAEEGRTIFLCTHDMELAAELAEEVYVLKAGRIIAAGSPHCLFSSRQLMKESGLSLPPMMDVSEDLAIEPCVTIEEVMAHVIQTDF